MNYPKGNTLLIVVLFFLISCGAIKPLAPNTVQISGSDLMPMPYIKPSKVARVDTVVKVELTDKQKLFYDKYFVPQFDALRTVVNKQSTSIQSQANSIQQLSDIIANMRVRSIRRNDSMQNALATERASRSLLEKVYLNEQRKQVARNAQQIANLNDIANVLIAATIIMILCILGLVVIAISLWKKVRILDKKVSHA